MYDIICWHYFKQGPIFTNNLLFSSYHLKSKDRKKSAYLLFSLNLFLSLHSIWNQIAVLICYCVKPEKLCCAVQKQTLTKEKTSSTMLEEMKNHSFCKSSRPHMKNAYSSQKQFKNQTQWRSFHSQNMPQISYF